MVSNFKMVLLVAAMIGGVGAGVHYGGKSFFKQMVGGGFFPDGPAKPSGKAWSSASPSAAQPARQPSERSQPANASEVRPESESEKEDLGFAEGTPGR